jgi:membrane protein DedA with SNARE-associated domain
MSILSGFVLWVTHFAIDILSATGYAGVFVLMALESMVTPIPSEAVMPFAGFLVGRGTLSLAGVWAASVLGSLTGSLLLYWIGARFGERAVKRFGKWVLLNEEHLEQTKRWFRTHGGKTVLFGRFVPVVRHLISIPAGAARMDLPRFILFTVIGAAAWNGFLLYLGIRLAEHWETVQQYLEPVSLAALIALVAP